MAQRTTSSRVRTGRDALGDAAAAVGARPSPGVGDGDRPDALWDMEGRLRRRGFTAVAGADEAGRGACAGPLVAAACVLPAGRRGRVPGLADSKLLTAAARERVYAEVVDRAVAWSVVTIPVEELDARGMHVTNIEALRRAVMTLAPGPDYVLTDGFPVSGLAQPTLAVWKGDRVAACVAAASVLAKVTRDRIMLELHERWPEYDFAGHKGYITDVHAAALDRHGPCPQHRMRFVNVARARDLHAARALEVPSPTAMVDDGAMSEVQAGRPGGSLATVASGEWAR
jgi:ribonuclease HII